MVHGFDGSLRIFTDHSVPSAAICQIRVPALHRLLGTRNRRQINSIRHGLPLLVEQVPYDRWITDLAAVEDQFPARIINFNPYLTCLAFEDKARLLALDVDME